jgi:hypothetical protein
LSLAKANGGSRKDCEWNGAANIAPGGVDSASASVLLPVAGVQIELTTLSFSIITSSLSTASPNLDLVVVDFGVATDRRGVPTENGIASVFRDSDSFHWARARRNRVYW